MQRNIKWFMAWKEGTPRFHVRKFISFEFYFFLLYFIFLFVVILLSTTLPEQEYKKKRKHEWEWKFIRKFHLWKNEKEMYAMLVAAAAVSYIYSVLLLLAAFINLLYRIVDWMEKKKYNKGKKFSHLLKLSLHLCHIVLTDFSLFSFHFLTLYQIHIPCHILHNQRDEKKIEWKSFSLKIMAKHFQFTSITIFHWSIAPSSECRKSAWFNRFFIIF